MQDVKISIWPCYDIVIPTSLYAHQQHAAGKTVRVIMVQLDRRMRAWFPPGARRALNRGHHRAHASSVQAAAVPGASNVTNVHRKGRDITLYYYRMYPWQIIRPIYNISRFIELRSKYFIKLFTFILQSNNFILCIFFCIEVIFLFMTKCCAWIW